MTLKYSISNAVLLLALTGCGGDEAGDRIAVRAEAAPAAQAPVPAGHGEAEIPLPQPSGEREIGVRLSEYSIEMTRERVPAGEIEFHVVNAGTTIHYLLVRSETVYSLTQHLPPGDSAVMSVTLAPGEYTYLCTIRDEFDHYSEGMRGTLVVY